MKHESAESLCKELMKANGVGKLWKFSWINKKRVYGWCDWRLKTISLSKRFVEINNEMEIRDCILHEIAHAKCHKHGHNKYWKAWCLKLGARPERLNRSANRPI